MKAAAPLMIPTLPDSDSAKEFFSTLQPSQSDLEHLENSTLEKDKILELKIYFQLFKAELPR